MKASHQCGVCGQFVSAEVFYDPKDLKSFPVPKPIRLVRLHMDPQQKSACGLTDECISDYIRIMGLLPWKDDMDVDETDFGLCEVRGETRVANGKKAW